MTNPPTTPMISQREAAEIVYKELKEMQRATFDVATDWGRWLLGSLLLIHGGALFGLFTFLSTLAGKPEALVQYQWTVWWFVAGVILTLLAGMMAWFNWSMHSDNYECMANKEMLWDSSKWVGNPPHGFWLGATHYAAIICGLLAAGCIVGGAYSTLNGKWVPQVVSAIV